MARSRPSSTQRRVSAPVTVFHGPRPPFLFSVEESFTESRSYREHVKRLSNRFSARDFLSLLTKLERLTSLRKRYQTRRKEPSVLWQRARFAWDFAPRVDYATRFANTTKRRLASKNESPRKEGKRALAVLIRLLFEAEWPRPGRRVKPKTGLRPEVRDERHTLLSELQGIYRGVPAGPQRRALVEGVITRELPGRALKDKIDRLLSRRTLRPVDVANQLLAWKHSVRPAMIQGVTAPPPEPPEIKFG